MNKKEYNLKKSAERLLWRFNLKKGFTPNEDDKKSLNCILEWINNEKKSNMQERAVILFSKLYIYVLNQNIRHFETDVLDSEPQRQLSKLLNTPLELFYEAFNKELENIILDRMMKRVKKENDDKFTKEEIYSFFDKTFQREQLNHMITEALNRF